MWVDLSVDERVRNAQNCGSRRSLSNPSHWAAISCCRPDLPPAAPLFDSTRALTNSESVSGMRSRFRRVKSAVASVPGVQNVTVNMVFDPPWDQSRMSDEARVALDTW